jgi:hypothetical protein
VTPPNAGNKLTAEKITGTVIDDVTGQPVTLVHVQVGDRSDTTDSQGKFEVRNVAGYHGLITIEATRTGYTTKTQQLTVSGNQTLTLRVQPLPTVHVRKTNSSTTIDYDLDSVEFGYPVLFSGYNKASSEEFCKPNGTAVTLSRTDIRRITGPATLVQQVSCCATHTLLKVNAELKTGEVTDLFFVDTCSSGIQGIDFIARNHITGVLEYTKFSDVSEIVFP